MSTPQQRVDAMIHPRIDAAFAGPSRGVKPRLVGKEVAEEFKALQVSDAALFDAFLEKAAIALVAVVCAKQSGFTVPGA